jgi:acyl-CoA synthetase (AMP-forming)/AMP-acid ligase II
VIFGGEVFPNQALLGLMARLPRARFYNLYGPTEAILCTATEIREVTNSPIPIGTAVEFADVRIVRENGASAAPGEVGEIVVRGPGVMLGYWPLPENPSWGRAREHRTGDFGYQDADGVFHFKGRRDAMIKVRGHRVEAAEVEAALLSHPSIEAAAVLCRPAMDGANRLAAIVVPKGTSPDERDLKRHCLRKLPPYMVPDLWIFRDHLALNTNGKIDRQALARELETPL